MKFLKSFYILFFIFTLSTLYAQNELKVENINKEKLEDLIQNRNGKALFLNFWATWCPPCVEEYPEIVKLAGEYKNNNIEFIGVSIDYPDEVESKIEPFLKKQNVNFKNYVNGFSKDEELINLISSKWSGAIPLTLIYNQNGKMEAYMFGGRNYGEFKEKIDEVLNK